MQGGFADAAPLVVVIFELNPEVIVRLNFYDGEAMEYTWEGGLWPHAAGLVSLAEQMVDAGYETTTSRQADVTAQVLAYGAGVTAQDLNLGFGGALARGRSAPMFDD
eukprot:10875328-Heterocapsa_arctica.AAC.1